MTLEVATSIIVYSLVTLGVGSIMYGIFRHWRERKSHKYTLKQSTVNVIKAYPEQRKLHMWRRCLSDDSSFALVSTSELPEGERAGQRAET